MAFGKKTVATFVAFAAVFTYYALIPVPANLTSSDYRVLRLSAVIMDTTALLRSLPTKAHIHWFNFNTWLGTGPFATDTSVKYTDMRTDNGIRVRLYEPIKKKPRRAGLLYFHGGGFVYGNTRSHHGLTHHLAAKLDAVVVSVDYRLAWQRPFPAALNDCTKATVWFLQHAKDYNVDPLRIAVAGDSAGGNLAAAVSARLTFNSEYASLPKLKFQGLIYPGLQILDFNTPSYQQNSNLSSLVLTKAFIGYCFSHYLTGTNELNEAMLVNNHTSPEAKKSIAKVMSHDLIPAEFKYDYTPPGPQDFGDTELFDKHSKVLLNPESSPLFREDLHGLPPAYVVTAQHDPIRDDGIMYVRRLEQAGVDVTWKHYENGVHGMFSLFAGLTRLEAGSQGVKDFIDYSKKNLRSGASSRL